MRRLIDRLRFGLDHRWAPDHMSEYLDGDLDARRRGRIERHVGDCPECEELLRALGTIVQALGGMRGRAGHGVAATVLAGVQERLEASGDDDRSL
jgi:anti-sigma factor RsiW